MKSRPLHQHTPKTSIFNYPTFLFVTIEFCIVFNEYEVLFITVNFLLFEEDVCHRLFADDVACQKQLKVVNTVICF